MRMPVSKAWPRVRRTDTEARNARITCRALGAHHAVVARLAALERPHRALKLVDLRLRVGLHRRAERVYPLQRAGGVEELLKFGGEEAKLVDEIVVVLSVVRVNGEPLEHGIDGDEVLRARVAVDLVLKRVLDLLLQVLGDVVAVRDVADARHRHRARELARKAGQPRVQVAHELPLHGRDRRAVLAVQGVQPPPPSRG